MATIPISDLESLPSTDVASGDELVINDISEALETDKTKKITYENLVANLVPRSGWIEISDGTWTYASATTITVPSGAASIYTAGNDQIRLKQGGDYKFFSLVAVADELLTIAENDDYTLTDATITDAAFSKGGGVGHPSWFGYTPVITSAAGSITTYNETSRFLIMGHLIKITLDINITDKGTAGGALLFTLPVTPIDPSIYIGTGREDTTAGNMLQVRLSGGIGVAVEYDNSTPFTGNNSIFLSGEYEI